MVAIAAGVIIFIIAVNLIGGLILMWYEEAPVSFSIAGMALAAGLFWLIFYAA